MEIIDYEYRISIRESVVEAIREMVADYSITECLDMKYQDFDFDLYAIVSDIIDEDDDSHYDKIMNEANGVAMSEFDIVMASIHRAYDDLNTFLSFKEAT